MARRSHHALAITLMGLWCAAGALGAPLPRDWATLAASSVEHNLTARLDPDPASESVREVCIEARLRIDDRGAAGTLVERTGMYRLWLEPGTNGASPSLPSLHWAVRAGGAWQTVRLPVTDPGAADAVASYNGRRVSLELGDATAQAEHVGLMAHNGEGLWLGMRPGEEDVLRGAGALVRVSSAMRSRGGVLFEREPVAGAPLAAEPAEPVDLSVKVTVPRPDGIASEARKIMPAPRLRIGFADEAPVIDGRDDERLWRTAALARSLPITTSYTPQARHPASFTMESRLAWDDSRLYGFLRLIAPGPGWFENGTDARDSWENLKDALELILAPRDPSTNGYYLLRFGTGGGLMDARSRADLMYTPEWNAEGLVYNVNRRDDVVDVEFALPFAALGVESPRAGDTWRGNLFAKLTHFRAGEPRRGDWVHNWTSWAFSWPLMEVPVHFGTFEFEARPAPAPDSVLRGRLVDRDGRPVAWSPLGASGAVDAQGRQALTDANGRFEIDSLVPEATVVQSLLPGWEPVARRVTLRPGMNELGDVVLAPRAPARPAWTPPAAVAPDAPVAWFRTWITSPPDMHTAPAPGQWEHPEPEAVLAPDETGTVAAAFVSRNGLVAPALRVGPVLDAAGGETAGVRVEVLWVTRLLSIRDHNNPPENADFLWRYLGAEAPAGGILAGETGLLALRVAVDAACPPGAYTAELNLHDGPERVSTLPLRLTVAPVTLREPDKLLGVYTYLYDTDGGHNPPLQPLELVEAQLRDQVEHGGRTVCICPLLNTPAPATAEQVFAAIRIAARLGMRTVVASFVPFDSGQPWNLTVTQRRLAPPGFSEECLAFEEILSGIEAEFPGLEIVPSWGDEVTLRPETFAAWKLQYDYFRARFPARRIALSAHPMHVNTFGALPGGDEGLLINWSYGVPGAQAWGPQALREWAADLVRRRLGRDAGWNYQNEAVVAWHDARVRLSAGYWLQGSPFRAHVPWCYYMYGGSPFDALDAYSTDVGFAAPLEQAGAWTLVSTLEWESWRDGYQDLRWLAALEAAVLAAGPEGSPEAVARGARLYRELTMLPGNVDTLAATLGPDAFVQRRRRIAEAIAALTP